MAKITTSDEEQPVQAGPFMRSGIKGPEFDMYFLIPAKPGTTLAKIQMSRRKDPVKIGKVKKIKTRK